MAIAKIKFRGNPGIAMAIAKIKFRGNPPRDFIVLTETAPDGRR